MTAETGSQISFESAPTELHIDDDVSLMRMIRKGISETTTSVNYKILQKSRILRRNRVVGWVGLRNTESGLPSMGYRLKPEAQGKGIATKAAMQVRDLGFELGADKILLTIGVSNDKSRAVAERLGAMQVPLEDSTIERWERWVLAKTDE